MANRNVPTFNSFHEFAARRIDLFAPPNEIGLALGSMRAHPVYTWFTANEAYRNIENEIKFEPWFQQQCLPVAGHADEAWELIWFASLVAQSIGWFLLASANSNFRYIVTAADLKKTQKAADDLLTQLDNVQLLMSSSDGAELRRLLDTLPRANTGQRLASRKSGEHVPVEHFAKALGLLLRSHYGEGLPDKLLNKIVLDAASVAQLAGAGPGGACEIDAPDIVTIRRHLRSIGAITKQDR